MKFGPNDWVIGLTFVLSALFICRQERRTWARIIRRGFRHSWSNTVGMWFARRRVVGRFTDRRYKRIRIGEPDMHSAGIMTARRDINTGIWS